MKNIFVPTDFSACAKNATQAALELAAFYGATLHLYSQINIRYDWLKLTKEEQNKYPEDQQRIHNTKVLLDEWTPIAVENEVAIKTSWSGGKLIENINNYIEANNIDFVVMGSHGASGKNEYFIGSNTQKVVRTVPCPVLIIKDDLSNYRIEKVVFASNFDPKEKKIFNYFLNFVKPFNPEIHLVQINTSSWFSQPYILAKELMNDFKALCGDLTCKVHFYRDWSVDAGVRHLSEEIGADLIAISNDHRHPLKRMFVGSNVEALVNHAKIPVLSIDLKD